MTNELPQGGLLSITWAGLLIGGVASLIRMLMVNGIIEGWKRIFDTEVDPVTMEPITVFIDSTTRGHKAVTQQDLDDFEAGGTTIVRAPNRKRVFHRPLWFSKILPALPWFHGILFAIALGIPLAIGTGAVDRSLWPQLLLFFGVVGFGEGASAHYFYRAFDDAGGYSGVVTFLRDRLSFLVKRKTGEPPSSEPTDGDAT